MEVTPRLTNRLLHFNCKIVPSVWEAYAKQMTPILLRQVQATGRDRLVHGSTRSVLLIETRPSELLPFTIYNSLLLTDSGVGLELCLTEEAEEFLRPLLDTLSGYRVHRVAQIPNPEAYSALLLRESFWQQFESETVLLVQTDSLLLKPFEWKPFEGVDYVGAPWNEEGGVSINWPDGIKVQRTLNACQNLGKNRVGNGGFSYRRVSAMIDALRKYPPKDYRQIGRYSLPEDLFFSRYVERVATYDVARKFATETDWNPEAYGMHKIWEYHSVDRFIELLQRHYLQVARKEPKQPSPE